jgi:ankyrin repeat protein
MLAADEGHAEIVDLLLEAGADVNARNECGWIALLSAVRNGHVHIVDRLLGAGSDVDAAGGFHPATALQIAADRGFVDVTTSLIRAGADPDAKGQFGPSLIGAASSGHGTIVLLLLGAGADVTPEDSDGCTALSYAVHFGHAEIARRLLNRGAPLGGGDAPTLPRSRPQTF